MVDVNGNEDENEPIKAWPAYISLCSGLFPDPRRTRVRIGNLHED